MHPINVFLVAVSSAMPVKRPAQTIPYAGYMYPYRPIPTPMYGQPHGVIPWLVRPVAGEVPLETNVYGQGYRVPDGRSYQTAFSINGPGVAGGGRSGMYSVDNGKGKSARGNSYAMLVRSSPVIDGKKVGMQTKLVSSIKEQKLASPLGGTRSSSFSSSFSTISG
ncbi:hypothetical protein DSO57_1009518 [Entomophthora muscae]|uniref:Uncharacterized protein n=1 Tax=Entomophthora muscae TaxID=34485 RepID=A0ACC2US68_9FUNG|nr:hypothetical protein DSO57_1009518 [Entomophthora muscae]